MSRTYFLPVTVAIDGNVASGLPPNLLFRDQADSVDPALRRTASRMMLPLGYDYPLEVYNQADQVIANLGLIDPVELWERSGQAGDRNAPDDFLATVSINGPTGDTSGVAMVTIVDANLRPRFAPFTLGSSSPAPYATRYGIPLFTGDRLLVDWTIAPLGGSSAFVTVSLTPCFGCELQTATALWVEALQDCCEEGIPAETCFAVLTAVIEDLTSGLVTPLGVPGPGLGVLSPPGGGPYQLDVTMDTAFDIADYTIEVLRNGVPLVLGAPPNFASVISLPAGPPGTQTIWRFEMGGGIPASFSVRVTKTANPACTFTQGFVVFIAN